MSMAEVEAHCPWFRCPKCKRLERWGTDEDDDCLCVGSGGIGWHSTGAGS